MCGGVSTTKRPRGGMSEAVSASDIGTALDGLAAAVERGGEDFVYQPVWTEESGYLTRRYANRGASGCMIGWALAVADVGVHEPEAMPDDGVRDVCLRRASPVTLTFEALQCSKRPSGVRISAAVGATYSHMEPLRRSGSSTSSCPTRNSTSPASRLTFRRVVSSCH